MAGVGIIHMWELLKRRQSISGCQGTPGDRAPIIKLSNQSMDDEVDKEVDEEEDERLDEGLEEDGLIWFGLVRMEAGCLWRILKLLCWHPFLPFLLTDNPLLPFPRAKAIPTITKPNVDINSVHWTVCVTKSPKTGKDGQPCTDCMYKEGHKGECWNINKGFFILGGWVSAKNTLSFFVSFFSAYFLDYLECSL